MNESSYRTILRSSSIMGAASILNILSGLAKMKVAAILLGPAGIGIIGLYQSLIQTGSQVAALGIGTAGTRRIAAAYAEGGDASVWPVRRTLYWGALFLAAIGGLAFFAASGWIAIYVLELPDRRTEVAWLSLGVALTVAAGSQTALLTGLRRIGDLARVQVASGILGAVIGSLALWIWGETGVLAMVLVIPIMTFALGHLYVSRLGPSPDRRASLREVIDEWSQMASLGMAFMASGLITTVGHLVIRTLVQRELGTDDLGNFQAAWLIGMTYLTFVLGAMGTDYFPRLSAAISDHAKVTRLINEQTEVALILCGPVLIGMLSLAPWVIGLLYSSDFTPAIDVLRWQIVGDIFKVMSWPLGYFLLAAGAGRAFFFSELLGIGVFVAGVAMGLPYFGVTSTGIAFLGLYALYLPTVSLFAFRLIKFRWTVRVILRGAILVASAVVVMVQAQFSDVMAMATGLALSSVIAIMGLLHLAKSGALPAWLSRLFQAANAAISEWRRR